MHDGRGVAPLIALAAAGCLVAVAAVCGTALLRPRGAVAFLLGTGLLAFGEVVAVTHALSLVDAWERGSLLAVLAVVAAGAVAATWIRRPPMPALRRGDVVRHLLADRLLAVLAVVVLAELAYLVALAVFTPPTEYDVLTYHLMRALLWIQQHAVAPVGDVTDTRIDEFPPNAEILQGATMLLSRSVRWVGLVQIGALLAATTAIYGIACRVGLERRQAAFGALLFPTLPVVAMQAPSALNDLVVAALVAAAAFFVLGRTRSDVVLACVAVALLVGTKVTAVLALPVVLALALLAHGGRQRWLLVGWGAAAAALGAVWQFRSAVEGAPAVATAGHTVGGDNGPLAVAARGSRYLVETLELPGGHGRNAYLFLVAAGVVAVAGALARARPRATAVAVALTALASLTLVLERVARSSYFHGWELVGYDRATRLGIVRDSTAASSLQSWYGPVGLALTVIAIVVVVRAARRRELPWTAVALATSPLVFVAGSTLATGYNTFSGRFAMGGVALAAATWGVVRPYGAGAAAAVAVAATTVVLSLVAFGERPAGIGLLEPAAHPSVWTFPRGWSQSIQPEISRVIEYLDAEARRGSTIAVTRDQAVYPFAYAGWPTIQHRIVYADTLAEATRRDARWAVLPAGVACAPGWEVALRSEEWAVYRHVSGATCR